MPLIRRTASALFTLIVIAAVVVFWPTYLGGSTRTLIVSGASMEPTYALGDMVVVRSSGAPGIGDVVVFAVPEGVGRGMLVIHRVVDVDTDGRLITQGDNRDTVDQWPLSAEDLVGTPILRIPMAGRIAMTLGRWPVTAAGLGLMMTLIMWPRRRPEDEFFDADRTDPDTTALPRPTTTRDEPDEEFAVGFGDHEIDPDVMAEAMAWLEQQLAELPRREPRHPERTDVTAPR